MDFGSLGMGSMSGRSSMRRKQSNSLLQALGKSSSRLSAIPVPTHHQHQQHHGQTASAPPSAYSTPQSSTAATFSDDLYSPSPDDGASILSRTGTASSSQGHGGPPSAFPHGHGHGHGFGHAHHGHPGAGGGGRSVSLNSATMGTSKDREKDRSGDKGLVLRRPEDVFRVVRERMLSWSYLMEWYQGDTHWFNTVRIPRSLVETSLGNGKLDSRARQFYTLGISLSALFDIPSAGDFLRALLKLLDDWENWSEGGGKGVRNIFRGPKSAKKPGTGGVMSDFTAGLDGSESYLLNINVPFTPDFFQVHSSTCSIIRDIYKKLLGMFLPSPSLAQNRSHLSLHSLAHPSTIIHSAPLDSPYPPNVPAAASAAGSTAGGAGGGTPVTATSATFATITSPSSMLVGTEPSGSSSFGHGYGHGSSGNAQAQIQGYDAFQALIAGELPNDRTLVGDGQKLTPQVVELFLKVDTKLKKHFSTLLREGDALARKVLDDELAALLASLAPGSKAMTFDFNAAFSGGVGGWAAAAGAGGGGGGGIGNTGTGTGTVWENEMSEFGTV